ncbi:MAG: hypothetical protein Greene101449_605, partial [Candidatus Peregrinibacteria bacterium Greene1014_49]
ANTPSAVCRTDCSLRRCGDGIRDFGESCDDGNRLGADGCSSLCALDTMLAGVLPPSWSFGGFPTFRVDPNGTMQLSYIRTADGRIMQIPADGRSNPWGLASFQQIALSHPPSGETGPGAVAVIAAGAGAGLAWVRRRRGRKGGANFL